MDFNWKKLSINDLEKNYNPREAVFNFSDYIEKYKTLGKEFRKKTSLHFGCKLWRYSSSKT